jgi:hypothetical protein
VTRKTLAAVVLAHIAAASASAAGETISAYGTGQVPVTPTDPNRNASIRAAVADAQTRVYPAALADATANAQVLAAAANFTLGPVRDVAQQAAVPYYGGFIGRNPIFVGGGPITGPYPNGRFCAYVTKPIRKRVTVRGITRLRVVRRVRVWTCYVPTTVFATVEVTFTATPKV